MARTTKSEKVPEKMRAKFDAIGALTDQVYQRTAGKYGDRAERYVHLEVGQAAQNLLLQAVALGLGGAPIGAFGDNQLQSALSLSKGHAPVYLIPVGYPAE